MKKSFTQILSLVLVLTMVLSFMPAAFAGDVTEEPQNVAEPVEETVPAETPAEPEAAEEPAEPVVEETPAQEEIPEEVTPVAEENPVEVIPEAAEEVPAAEEVEIAEEVSEEAAPVEEEPAVEEEEEEEEFFFVESQLFKYEDVNTGLVVYAEANGDALSDATELRVKRVNGADYKDAAAAAVNADVNVALALDINFRDAFGNEIEPANDGTVTVRIQAPELANVKNAQIVHFTDEGDTEIAKQVSAEAAEELTGTPLAPNEVCFTATKFSVYAIVGEDPETESNTKSIKYEFYTDDTFSTPFEFTNKDGITVSYQYVSNGTGIDPEDRNDVIINPGAPEVKQGMVFFGWYAQGTTENPVIPANQAEVIISDISETTTVKLYPLYVKAYFLEYYDEKGMIYKTESSIDGDFTLNGTKASLKNGSDWRVTYQPDSNTQAFQGWCLVRGGNTVVNEVDFNGDADNKIELYPFSANVYWISFDKNDWVTDETTGERKGTGALFVAPIYVLQTDESVAARHSSLPTTTRPGYTFDGWYNDEACTDGPFDLNTKLNDNITLHAKWTPAQTQYVVNIYRQYASDAVDATNAEKTYYYDGNITRTAPTGSDVSLQASDKTGAGTGFKYNAAKSDDTTVKQVLADGSTVLNVYYDRQDYTLTFQRNTGTYNSWTGRWSGTWYTDDTLTIHELYGHKIADQFTGERWLDYLGTKYATNKVLVMIDIMPDDDIVFRYSDPGNRPTKTMYYMVEALPGVTPTRTWNRIGFVEYTHKAARYNQVTENEDFMDLEGFEKLGSDPAFQNGVALDDQNHNGTIYMYYSRRSFDLEFIDTYNNENIGTASVLYENTLKDNKTTFTVSEDNSTITGLGKTVSHEGYEFTGWYSDPSCKTPFDFDNTKMPSSPLKVYAGWKILRYRVWIQPNGGVLSPTESTYFRANWGELVQEYTDVETEGRNYYASDDGEYSYIHIASTDPSLENARVAYYWKTSDLGTVTKWLGDNHDNDSSTYDEHDHTDGKSYKYLKDAYTFVGWYKVNTTVDDNVEPAININDSITPFNFNTPIKENTAIRAIWKRVGSFQVTYDPNMYSKYTPEQGWLAEDKILDGAEGATVPEGTTYIYGDQSDAIAAGSPDKSPDGYIFVGWKLPTGEIIQTNDIFKIYAELAVMMNQETSADPEFDYILSAVYEQLDSTYLTYDVNAPEGETAVSSTLTDLESLEYEGKNDKAPVFEENKVSSIVKNSKIQLSNGEGFAVKGYQLLGWNDDQDAAKAGTVKFDLGGKYGIGAPTTLYAVWSTPVFYVVTSHDAVMTAYKVSDYSASNPFNMMDAVAEGYRYGGYYKQYITFDQNSAVVMDTKSGTAVEDMEVYTAASLKAADEAKTKFFVKANAYTDDGRKVVPTKGAIYYVKEVPEAYLGSRISYVYDWATENSDLIKFYLLTAVDDNNYQKVQFKVITDGDYVAKIVSSFSITQRNSTEKFTNKATDFTGVDTIGRGYLGYGDASDMLGGKNLGSGNKFTMIPQWITPDGVTVDGAARNFVFESFTKTGIKEA